LISKDAKTRLFQFLKDWADQEGERGNKVVIDYLTKTILQIICTSRQTATHLLNEMETNGTIITGKK
jgi:CRP/FNR family transcriptional regulator